MTQPADPRFQLGAYVTNGIPGLKQGRLYEVVAHPDKFKGNITLEDAGTGDRKAVNVAQYFSLYRLIRAAPATPATLTEAA